jgi:outer membrane receptor for ferrienterochelin and colicin
VSVLLAGIALAAIPSTLFSQAQASSGIIRGTVLDNDGRAIAGATITVRHIETNQSRSVSTNRQGAYVATLLRVGTYDVAVRFIGYQSSRRDGIAVSLGRASLVNFRLNASAVELEEIIVVAANPEVDVSAVASKTSFSDQAIEAIPNDGRNLQNLVVLTPNVAVVQGPDGDEITIAGQRGIHNNVMVDGADFNNPFFGEQRGGQRPAFVFNIDAIQEMVVIAQGANAEFGRSSGGFVNIVTKSGGNRVHGTAHYFGQGSGMSADFPTQGPFIGFEPDFSRHQFGFTLGGPIKQDKAFYFVAFDMQKRTETKQKTRLDSISPALVAWTDTAFTGALAGDFGPITRKDDNIVLLAKVDWRMGEKHFAALKYNFSDANQPNGTNDVDTWGLSSNGVELVQSNAFNGSLTSLFSSTVSNEFRFQLSREDRPRPYEHAINPSASRPFPDTDVGFVAGDGSFQSYRFGMPFFLPVESFDTRFQILDNISWSTGNHLFKVGGEYNRTEETQTFLGFANGRMAFTSVNGFLNYNADPTYLECADGSSGNQSSGFSCVAGDPIGPVALYLQFTGLNGLSVEEAGTQELKQQEVALFIQDSWRPQSNLTVDYGLRWEAQIQPDVLTAPSDVFFSPFIGQTVTNSVGTFAFPSDGTIPSDYGMFQPRLGISWDINDNDQSVLRASAGVYYARIPGLTLASVRSTNGSIGANLFGNNEFSLPLPAYGDLLPLLPPGTDPFQPGVFVADKDLQNPRTISASVAYEQAFGRGLVGLLSYVHADTRNLMRFVNRNDAVFGSPFGDFGNVGGTPGNGLGDLTTVESSARSVYNGITLGLKLINSPKIQFDVNYTLSWDKSDDDNERDPFSFRYARADALDREYNWSDRDQRHRLNAWLFWEIPWQIYLNNRVAYQSAQPASEVCGAGNAGTGARASAQSDRICADGSVLLRNTLRKNNEFFTWDLQIQRPFPAGGGFLTVQVDIFNLTNNSNFLDPSTTGTFLNFDGTFQSGQGTPRRAQVGMRYAF